MNYEWERTAKEEKAQLDAKLTEALKKIDPLDALVIEETVKLRDGWLDRLSSAEGAMKMLEMTENHLNMDEDSLMSIVNAMIFNCHMTYAEAIEYAKALARKHGIAEETFDAVLQRP